MATSFIDRYNQRQREKKSQELAVQAQQEEAAGVDARQTRAKLEQVQSQIETERVEMAAQERMRRQKMSAAVSAAAPAAQPAALNTAAMSDEEIAQRHADLQKEVDRRAAALEMFNTAAGPVDAAEKAAAQRAYDDAVAAQNNFTAGLERDYTDRNQYNYINNVGGAQEKEDERFGKLWFSSEGDHNDMSRYKYMTDDERAQYNELYAVSPQKAAEYREGLEDELKVRQGYVMGQGEVVDKYVGEQAEDYEKAVRDAELANNDAMYNPLLSEEQKAAAQKAYDDAVAARDAYYAQLEKDQTEQSAVGFVVKQSAQMGDWKPDYDVFETLDETVERAGQAAKNSMGAVFDWAGQTVTNPSAADYANEFVRMSYEDENENFLGTGNSWQELALSTGDVIGAQIPGWAAGLLNPTLGHIVQGATSGAAAYREKRLQGYSNEQANMYGALTGMSEYVLGQVLGGIGGTAGLSEEMLLPKIAMWDNAIARVAATLGVNIASEEVEEALQNYAIDPLMRRFIFGEEFDAPNGQEILESALLTAVSAALMSGGQTVQMGVDPTSYRQQYVQNEVDKAIGRAKRLQSRDERLVNRVKRRRAKAEAAKPQSAADMVLEEAGVQTPSNPTAPQTLQEMQPTTPQTGAESLTQPSISAEAVERQREAVAAEKAAIEELVAAVRLDAAKSDGNVDPELYSGVQRRLGVYEQMSSELMRMEQSYAAVEQAERIKTKEVSNGFNTPQNHIDRRSDEAISNRSVKAFQFDHPELKPYYANVAQEIIRDVSNGERHQNRGAAKTRNGAFAFVDSPLVKQAVRMGLSRPAAARIAADIIADKGQENYADAKRLEKVIDYALSNGYRNFNGQYVEPNGDYIAAKEKIAGAVTQDSWEYWLRENELALADGSTTEAELRKEWEAQQRANQQLPPGMGAAEAGFSSGFDQMQGRTADKDFHPVNENAGQEMMDLRGRAISEVPKTDALSRNIGKTANTLLNSPVTTNETAAYIEQQIALGNASYLPYSNKRSADNALHKIYNTSFAEQLSKWQKDVQNSIASADVTAMGAVLWNVANATGNTEAIKIITPLAMQYGRNIGQAQQAMRMFNALSPTDRIDAIIETARGIAGEQVSIEMPAELRAEYLQAKSPEEQKSAIEAIYKSIAMQIPRTFQQQFDTLRFTMMLLNPQSAFRNNVGNVVQAIATVGKNVHATAFEWAFSSWVENNGGKTKAILNPASAKDWALIKWAGQTYSDVQTIIDNGGRFGQSETQKILEKQPAFTNILTKDGRVINVPKWITWVPNAANKLSSALMSDKPFSISHYSTAYASWLKANGITAEMLYSGNVDIAKLDKGQEYAIEEAQKATFRDDNLLSSSLASAMKANAKVPIWGKVVQGVMPFVKTPANMFVRGVGEYSPIGLVRGLKQALVDVRKGKVEAADALNLIASGATGTELVILGYWMMATGTLTLGGSGDDKEDKFNEMRGQQNYALVVGDKSYTLSWLGATALPIFFGAEFYNSFVANSGEDRDLSAKDIAKEGLEIAGRFIDPLMEMSLLSGVDSLASDLGSVQYYGWATTLAKVALNYYLQAFPTVFGKTENLFEPERQQTYTTDDSIVPKALQYTVASLAEKIPFWDYNQMAYVDAWGRRQSNGGAGERFLENFVSPGYYGEDRSTPIDSELQRLYEAMGGDDTYTILPTRPSYSSTQLTWENRAGKTEHRDLTPEEFVEYQEIRGQTSLEILTEFIGGDRWDDMNDEERAKYVDMVYDYATETAKNDIDRRDEVPKWMAAKPRGMSEADWIYMAATYGSDTVADRYGDLARAGVDMDTAGAIFNAAADARADAAADGRTSPRDSEYTHSINELRGVSDEDKVAAVAEYCGADSGEAIRYTAALDAGFSYAEWTSICDEIAVLPQPTDNDPRRLAGSSPNRDVLIAYLEANHDPETAAKIYAIWQKSRKWKEDY